MSARDQKLDLLAGVPLFGQLGKHELQRVGQLADVLDLPAGRTLMRQGERGAEAMVIVEGRANVERDGRVLYEAGPGDVLGEMALLSNRPRIATVTLLTDTRLLVLARREFDALMTEMPSVRAQVMENLALRLMAAEDSATH
jgi:CRP-like cAMP-binding protein